MALTKIGTTGISNNLDVPGYLYLSGDEKELRFYNGANYMVLKASGSLSNNYTFTLPVDDGTTGQFLQTNGSGVLTWAAAGGGTTINNATANELVTVASTTSELDAEANLTFDGNVLTQSRSGSSEHFINSYTTGTYNPSRIWLNKSQHGTVGSHGALESGDQMGVIYFGGSTGSALREGAQIMATAEQTWVENSARGTRLDFSTVPNGSNSMALAMRISNAGEITMPKQPAFFAQISTIITNVTGAGTTYTIAFQSEIFDQNADFDGSSTFTAPVTGRYFFWSSISLENVTTSSTNGLTTFNASNRICYAMTPTAHPNAGNVIVGSSAFVDMDANDTCTLKMRAYGESSNVIDINPGTYFAGYLAV